MTFRSAERNIASHMPGTTTHRLQIFTPKFNSERTRANLWDAAAEYELKVDAMTGSRGLLGYRLNVTVIGSPEQIEAFHRRFQGDGWSGSGGSDLLEIILNPILAGVFGESQRSLASKWRLRKLNRQAVDEKQSA